MSIKKKRVFVGMSGGVDSSVTVALLKGWGFDVVGVFIKSYNVDGCGERDANDARRVAEQLKIPFYVFDLEKEYKERVVQYMVDGYKNGLTPNPDVMCNKEIKFGLFLKRALELGADYVAPGHYVRLVEQADSYFYRETDKFFPAKNFPILGRKLLTKRFLPAQSPLLNSCQFALKIAKDKNKDQSYFLWTLTQNQLKHCLFPIGEYTKPQIRKMAKKFSLITAEKKDSQGICFLGKISLPEFLEGYLPKNKGDVLNVSGEKIGQHNGAHFYTIGQRHGLGIGGSSKPQYISDKNIKNNTVTIAEGENNPALYKKEVKLTNINFIPKLKIENYELEILTRVRYRQPLVKATLKFLNSETPACRQAGLKLTFSRPQKFVASGQSAVFYDKGGEMLGGGVIV